MAIQPKSTPDPVSALILPDAMLRWALLAAEEVAGKQGIAIALREAGLEALIENYPPEELLATGKFSNVHYAAFNAALLNFFGRGGRSMVMRIGRISYRLGLVKYGPIIGSTLATAVKLIPESRRPKLGLEAVRFAWDKVYKDSKLPPVGISVEDSGDKLIWSNRGCQVCAGKQSEAACCYLGTGYLQEAMHWLMEKDYEVREVKCRALGDPACVWEVNKTPKE